MPEVKSINETAAPSIPVNSAVQKKKSPGLSFRRLFTKPGVSPYDEVEWELRTAAITDAQGNVIFEQKNVEVPKDWSMTATNIVASKYLHGKIGTPQREKGVRELVGRVAETIRDWGMSQGYFRTPKTAPLSTTNSFTSSSASMRPSIRPSGSTWDAIASSPILTARTGTGTRRRSRSNSASPDTPSRSAPPASSIR